MIQLAQAAILALLLSSAPAFGHGSEDSHGATIGKPGELTKVSRTVTVEMNDAMRFTPGNIAVK